MGVGGGEDISQEKWLRLNFGPNFAGHFKASYIYLFIYQLGRKYLQANKYMKENILSNKHLYLLDTLKT